MSADNYRTLAARDIWGYPSSRTSERIKTTDSKGGDKMDYTVDGWNNFCRVFEIPNTFPSGYCFGGGHPIEFQLVDWFNPVDGIGNAAVSKEVWREKVGEIEIKTISLDKLYETLIPFLTEKKYVKPGREYIILCDFGAVLSFKKSVTTAKEVVKQLTKIPE